MWKKNCKKNLGNLYMLKNYKVFKKFRLFFSNFYVGVFLKMCCTVCVYRKMFNFDSMFSG